MTEHNDDRSSEIINGLDPNYEYDKILDGLEDIPLGGLESDDEDWDPSKSQDLGPIPPLMDLFPPNIDNDSVKKRPSRSRNAPIGIESEQKEQQADSVVRVHRNGAVAVQNVLSPGTSAFQTQSPISVLESSGTCLSGKSLPTRFEKVTPVRARSKRGRPSNAKPWFLKTPIACSVANKSPNSITGKKRPRMSELPEEQKFSFQHSTKELQKDPSYAGNKVTSTRRSIRAKRCTHCNVTNTPQWREGPLGKNTLCNACGVRYRSGRLHPEYRPAASPTFSPSLHSNSHRKVEEMRKQAIQEPVLVETPTSWLCTLCNVINTPQWREGEGPLGKNTLCNTCGVRYSSGSLHPEYRPAASPTFSPSLHSNSHRKVEEMRKQAIQEPDLVQTPTSSLAESVPMSNDPLDDTMSKK